MSKLGAPFVVTIDGPSASGKSSVSRDVARRHGWKWVSTGAFYRGLAVVALAKNVSTTDESRLVELANNSLWEVRLDEALTRVFLEGREITEQVYREETGANASKISQLSRVRASLLEAQRKCALNQKGLVAEGRDCGTVVFPNAQLKIYLTAGSEERLARRAREEGRKVEETRDKQIQRDHQDSTRTAAPLQIPENAVVIDTSHMDLAAVVQFVDEKISRLIKT